jgi:hypothetical protein
MSALSIGRMFRFFAAGLAVASLLPITSRRGFAFEFCQASSAIDQIPFFVEQTSHDVLDQPADRQEQTSRADQLKDMNLKTCHSRDPLVAGTGCEWKNNAQVVLDMLGSAQSVAKNGSTASNQEFVTVLYKVLLRRPPDGSGLQARVRALDSGGMRASVVLSILASDEYRHRFSCNREAQEARGGVQLGVNGHPCRPGVYQDSNVSYDDQLAQIKALGFQWYRVDVGAASTGQDYTAMDTLLKKAQAQGINILPIIFAVIDRDHDSPSTIYQKSYDGAFKFATHFKGSFQVYELSNEQDNYSKNPGPGDQPGMYDARRWSVVTSMLRGMSEGVHAADPSAKRMVNFAGWLHTGFFQRVENDHIAYEIVGVHWYEKELEITCPGQSHPCPARPQHFNVIQRLQSITHNKPMWVTETNYSPLDNNSPEQNNDKEKFVVSNLQRWINSPKVYPFEVIIIYELLDEPNMGGGASQQQVGLISVTRRPDGKWAMGAVKPAFESLQRNFKRD